jgi:hypothetical protein
MGYFIFIAYPFFAQPGEKTIRKELKMTRLLRTA